jgi:hypothetical protein
MEALADFLNHGTLPFAGREAELSRIMEFWRDAPEGEEVRAMLLLGEAGAGKSRLLREAVDRIEREGGAVIHCRLYPESTIALARLVADALWSGLNVRPLLREEPEPTLGAVADALRRTARLRPTLLAVEDIHLLSGPTLREFASLIDAIGDEPIALLSTARPLDLPARGIMERHPLVEIALEGLSIEDLGAMWRELFGNDPDPAVLRSLGEATLGNGLALRSALRGAVSQESLVQRGDGLWVTDARFDRVVARSSRSLIEGMVAHLSKEMRAAAGRMALLGEVVSREAAERLVEPRVVDDLLFEGVLHELTLPKPPIPRFEKSIDPLLAFTHSLVHRALLERVDPPVEPLLSIIGEGLPLYAVVPFTALLNHPMFAEGGENKPEENDHLAQLHAIPLETIRSAITKALVVASAIDSTADWGLAPDIWRLADRLIEASAVRWEPEQLAVQQAESIARHIDLLRRSIGTPEYDAALEQLTELTRNPSTIELARFEIHAISYGYWRNREHSEPGGYLDRLVRLVENFPALRSDRPYSAVLRDFSQIALDNDDNTIRRRIEAEYERLIADPDIADSTRNLARSCVGPSLLTLFDTPEELARRLDLYQRLSEVDNPDLFIYGTERPYFLMPIGRIDEMVEAIEDVLPEIQRRGMMRTWYTRRVMLLTGEALLGMDRKEFLEGIRQIEDESRNDSTDSDFSIALNRAYVALLFNDADLLSIARDNINRLTDAVRSRWSVLLEPEELLDIGGEEGGVGPEKWIELLQRPLLRLDGIIDIRSAIAALERVSVVDDLRDEVNAALQGALDWLAERRLDALMGALLDAYSDYFDAKKISAWRKRIAEIAASRRRKSDSKEKKDDRLVLTMLGRIEIVSPDSGIETIRPRGARQKALLGALVAGELLPHPMEREEFLEAAGIDTDDPKLARDAANSAIFRLRELIGHDAIILDGERPVLNSKHIRCDLVDAHKLLERARTSARRGELGRAQTSLLAALEILRGDVPFPALYDDFFERLRDELEITLRDTLLDVVKRCRREEDEEGANALLERGKWLIDNY